MARARVFVSRYGVVGLVSARAVPVLAEATVVFAGVARFPFNRFVIAIGIANLGIAATYAAIGAYAFDVNSFLLAFAGAIAVPAVAIGIASWLERSSSRFTGHRRLRKRPNSNNA